MCIAICILACVTSGRAQNPRQTPEPQSQTRQDQVEVLRVFTELVQTDVMVFDKQGRFANGLTSADFELRIDGKPKPIEFFERVTAGSKNEELQLAAARGSARPASPRPEAPTPLDRGRPIFFYVDDLHLDLPSMQATRKLIAHFIDNEMGQNDEAAIASATGQIGFLQQLTDNKAVLRAALERLNLRPLTVRDTDRPNMTEYQAVQIMNNDRDIKEYFIDATVHLYPGMPRNAAEATVLARANSLSHQGENITTSTLAGLESLVRAANNVPGRKLVFFISGGFFLSPGASHVKERLQRITSAAARSGVVIYSMDARGLISNVIDASSDAEIDPYGGGRLLHFQSLEITASQDGLHSLARDTGGKTVFNTNSLEPGLSRALKETTTYYLLAWKPEPEASHASKFRRIEVKVVGRPDLTVQVRRGFFDREPEAPEAAKSQKNDTTKKESEAAKSPEGELRKALYAAYPRRDIPVSLNLVYVNTPEKGPQLTATMQVPNELLAFMPLNGKQVAKLMVAGAVLNDHGKAGASFSDHLTVESPSVEVAKTAPDLTYAYPLYIKPGLYQVRVGVRDEQSGRSGVAHSWIEVPNIPAGQLALSSLMLGERAKSIPRNPSETATKSTDPVDMSITHHFTANGYLRFLVMVYNAARAASDSKPDAAIQVQVVREDQPVITTPLSRIRSDDPSQPATIPYAAELSLNGLPAGRYLLRVTVVDRITKQSASQQTRFDIE